MKKEAQMECLYQTQRILEAWWDKDPQPFIDAMDEDIMWIASGREEYHFGKEECLAHCVRLEDLPNVYLRGQEYTIVHSDRDTCVVAGRYIGYTEEGEDMVLSETQRVSFVWKHKKGRLSIIHLHLSNALHILEDGEDFPRRAGLETAAYLQRLLSDWTGSSPTVVISGAGGRDHVIPLVDILYVEADGECCQIYTIYTTIRCMESFKAVTAKLGDGFFQIHRGIVVNVDSVRLVEPGKLTLFQGTKLPIARRRMQAFRDRIRHR